MQSEQAAWTEWRDRGIACGHIAYIPLDVRCRWSCERTGQSVCVRYSTRSTGGVPIECIQAVRTFQSRRSECVLVRLLYRLGGQSIESQ
jgi:hypothetical protein